MPALLLLAASNQELLNSSPPPFRQVRFGGQTSNSCTLSLIGNSQSASARGASKTESSAGSARIVRMTSFHTGAAAPAPVAFRIGRPSVLPTHTPARRWRVYPIVQASRLLSVVPVLAATGRLRVSWLLAPNIGARAGSSLRMSVIMEAAASEITGMPSGELFSSKVTPCPSAIVRTYRGRR